MSSITTLEDVEWAATGRHRFRAVMVAAFAALAVMLAMVGVFGILAYSVQQRMRDFGVRRALGATSSDVMRLVVGSAMKVIATGAVIGLVLSAAFGRLIATMLFGVQPLDFVDVRAGHAWCSADGGDLGRRSGLARGADRSRRSAPLDEVTDTGGRTAGPPARHSFHLRCSCHFTCIVV